MLFHGLDPTIPIGSPEAGPIHVKQRRFANNGVNHAPRDAVPAQFNIEIAGFTVVSMNHPERQVRFRATGFDVADLKSGPKW